MSNRKHLKSTRAFFRHSVVSWPRACNAIEDPGTFELCALRIASRTWRYIRLAGDNDMTLVAAIAEPLPRLFRDRNEDDGNNVRCREAHSRGHRCVLVVREARTAKALAFVTHDGSIVCGSDEYIVEGEEAVRSLGDRHEGSTSKPVRYRLLNDDQKKELTEFGGYEGHTPGGGATEENFGSALTLKVGVGKRG